MSYITIPNFSWKDPVASVGNLPTDSNSNGDVRVTLDTDVIYIWNGSSWVAVASPGGSPTAITSLIGDITATGPGVATATLATVNGNVGSFGSSTAIPSFTVNAKGLVTAASTNVVIAPAGTLTGTTLASNVVSSSLTSVGTITTGVWNGTTIAIAHGGTGQTTANAAFAALSPMTTAGDIVYENATPLPDRLPIGSTGQVLTVAGGLPTWANSTAGFTNPMTTLGDMIYENATPAPARLPGNTTATKNFLTQTGTGSISATPAWGTIATGDLPTGNLTDVGTDGITVTGGTGAVIGSGTSLSQHVADTTHNGYLSSTDWNTFNGKQASGNYITALTGDITATGPGSVAATLATVNANVGSFGSSTAIPNFTVNAKGLITAAGTSVVIAPAGTLTGTTLASNVVSSSLTSVGTIATGVWNGTLIGVGFGGTGTSTAFTPGSVVFAGASGVYSQDNAQLFWDNTNFTLGIGTNTPAANTVIDTVNSSGAGKSFQMTSYGVSSTSVFRGRFARGTSGSPTAAQNTDNLATFSARGYGTSQFATASTGAINLVAGETFTNTSNLTYIQFSTTPTGSVTTAESARITSTGTTLGPQSSSTAIHTIAGGMQMTTRTITANLTIDTTTTDSVIFCNQSGAITVTLPTPTVGRRLIIKDISGTAQTNNITLARHASESIEGLAASRILQTNWGSWTIISDGTNWFIL